MTSSIGATPVPGVGTSFIPDLTESANIQTALKLLYYGTTQTATTNGIYGSLASLQTQISATQAGINVHENVKAATLLGTPIPGVYAAGTADLSGGTGIGAKITYSATGVVTIDGVTLALNDRILVKDGTTALSGVNSIANGIYYVSTLGAVGVACVLTRSTDGDNSIQGETAEGDFVFVSGGTATNNNTSWVLTSSSPTGTGPAGAIKIGTDPITYVQFGAITWGNQTASTFFAAPTGSAGTPSFRAISTSDFTQAASPTSGQALVAAPVTGGWSWASFLLLSGGTLTGQLNLAANSTSVAPLDFNTTGSLLTTPLLGAMEVDANAIYYTDNPGGTGGSATGAGRGTLLPKQMVFLQSASGNSSSTTAVNIFATTNDVLSVLEPAKTYRFRGTYFSSVNYGGTAVGTNILFAFSNAPVATKYKFKTYPQTAGTTTTLQGVVTTNAASNIVPTIGTTTSYVTEIEGYFTTHATLVSTLTPQFAANLAAGGSSTTILTGSWFEIEKLGSSTVTNVAGNWA